ncbi:MAG: PASTA domain-containing protein [bacterium]|nr:MAG: PASTA domain-containing protein [bacterium]
MSGQFPQWRLRLLSVFAALIVCILLYRIVQIQITRHDEYLQRAKDQWHEKITWPARRGSIFDRNGVPLAVTHRIYTLGVTPSHFLENVEAVNYVADLLGHSPRRLRTTLPKDRVYVPLSRDLHLTEDQVHQLSSLHGVRLDSNHDRLYPFGSVPQRLIGSINHSGSGVAGVELAFQSHLAGANGWLLANKDARDSTFHLANAPGRRPRNGGDVYLTIDSGVQSIVDFEIQQAVERYGARRGVAVILDPFTGDILALSERYADAGASVSNLPDATALYSVSCIYEPGSTFKLVTHSYLLEHGIATPYSVYYGEKGKAAFDFGTFRDDHPHEWLNFKESFVHSSNICTIKAVCGSDTYDFYRYIMHFGFGGRTGISLPAESGGTLRPPKEWSARSLPSISIGHEIGVTVLQMAMAYCALANGGELLSPRIAIGFHDGKGCTRTELPVVRVRRVFSEKTAAMLKEFCREVVVKGTGEKAAVDGIPVAGKTGTSQKAGSNGYEPGKYIASFIGFAPVAKPRVVCLVLLDEPTYPYYWGGESAAVVFSHIIEGINLSTDLIIGEPTWEVAVPEERVERVERVTVPSLLRLPYEDAEALASRNGFTVESNSTRGFVYSQTPGPGTLSERGRTIRLLFGPSRAGAQAKVRVPDLVGLSIREARRMLLSCGLKSRVKGYGIVARQRPRAGLYVQSASAVMLVCNSPCPVVQRTKLAHRR